MNGRTLLVLTAIAVFVIAGLGLCGNTLVDQAVPQVTQGEEIRMIQPPKNGILAYLMLEKEAYAAQEVNVPNSQANLNNGQGRLANAQATLAVAKAEALQKEAARLNNEQFSQGKTNGLFLGGLGGICLGIFGVIAFVGLLAFFLNRSAGGVG